MPTPRRSQPNYGNKEHLPELYNSIKNELFSPTYWYILCGYIYNLHHTFARPDPLSILSIFM